MSTALLIGAPALLIFFTVVTIGSIYLNREAEKQKVNGLVVKSNGRDQ